MNNNNNSSNSNNNKSNNEIINIQWVKDKISVGNIFNRHASNQRFQRNDSSNSNSSTNSAPVTTTNTPISTPLHYSQRISDKILMRTQSPFSMSLNDYNMNSNDNDNNSNNVTKHQPNLAYSNRQNSFPAPRPKKYQQTSGGIGGSQNTSHNPKLSIKSNSANSIITNFNFNNNNTSNSFNHGSGSLRRRRFKQQYQHRRQERRLSRHGSSGTSISTSQEYSSSGTSITANPIVDRLLDYIRENYTKQMEPFPFEINKKFRLTSFASFRMESGQLYGTSNFERIGDSKLIKSSDEFAQIILASKILFSDVLFDILFSTKIARFMMRNKHLKIFIEKLIIYLELAIDHTMSAKIKILRLISIDGVETKTIGMPFPLNKSFDVYSLKTIHTMAANSEQYTNQIVSIINEFCDNLIENAIKSLSLMDLFW